MADSLTRRAEPLTLGELRQLAELRRELGVPEAMQATPAQMLELVRRAPDALLLRLIENWRQWADDAERCFIENHDREIERLRRHQRADIAAELAAVIPDALIPPRTLVKVARGVEVWHCEPTSVPLATSAPVFRIVLDREEPHRG